MHTSRPSMIAINLEPSLLVEYNVFSPWRKHIPSCASPSNNIEVVTRLWQAWKIIASLDLSHNPTEDNQA